MREGIIGVGSIGIHEPGGLCRFGRHSVMVDDADQNAGLERFGNACDIGSATVNGEDQFYSIFQCGGDRPLGDAVAISITLRDVAFGDRPNGAQRSDHDRCACQTIGVEVTNHKDGLPLCAGSPKPRNKAGRIWEEMWIVQGAIVAIKELPRARRIGQATSMQQRCQREMQMLWDQQVREELQQLCTHREFALGGRMERGDRL